MYMHASLEASCGSTSGTAVGDLTSSETSESVQSRLSQSRLGNSDFRRLFVNKKIKEREPIMNGPSPKAYSSPGMLLLPLGVGGVCIDRPGLSLAWIGPPLRLLQHRLPSLRFPRETVLSCPPLTRPSFLPSTPLTSAGEHM